MSFPGSPDPDGLSYKGGNTSADLGAREGMADTEEEQVPGSPGTHDSSCETHNSSPNNAEVH